MWQYEVNISRDRTKQRVGNGVIEKGEKVPLHIFDPESDLEVSIRMEGFQWSTPAVINVDVVDNIEMKDQAKRPLRVNVLAKNESGESKGLPNVWCVMFTSDPFPLRAQHSCRCQEGLLPYGFLAHQQDRTSSTL